MGPPTEPPNWFRLNFLLRGGEVALGVESGVAHKFEEGSVKVVGPGFCGDQHGWSGSGAVFGGVGVGQDLELLNVIDGGKNGDAAGGQLVVVDAIQQPVVLLGREPPTDSEKEPRAATSLLAAEVKKLLGLVSAVAPAVSVASCTKSRPFKGSCDTCCEVMTWPSDGLVVSTATASPETATVVDYGGGHERKIEFAGFIDLEMQIFGFGALKARRIDVHGVGSDRE